MNNEAINAKQIVLCIYGRARCEVGRHSRVDSQTANDIKFSESDVQLAWMDPNINKIMFRILK